MNITWLDCEGLRCLLGTISALKLNTRGFAKHMIITWLDCEGIVQETMLAQTHSQGQEAPQLDSERWPGGGYLPAKCWDSSLILDLPSQPAYIWSVWWGAWRWCSGPLRYFEDLFDWICGWQVAILWRPPGWFALVFGIVWLINIRN